MPHSNFQLLGSTLQLVGALEQLSKLVVWRSVIRFQLHCLFKGLLCLRLSVVAQPNRSQVIPEARIRRFAGDCAGQDLFRFAIPAFVSQRSRVKEKGTHGVWVEYQSMVETLEGI